RPPGEAQVGARVGRRPGERHAACVVQRAVELDVVAEVEVTAQLRQPLRRAGLFVRVHRAVDARAQLAPGGLDVQALAEPRRGADRAAPGRAGSGIGEAADDAF